jgi:hypothetical protein
MYLTHVIFRAVAWGTDVLSRAAVPLIYSRQEYLLVDELIHADRRAGTMLLAKLCRCTGRDGERL